ncbi:hypothetical protein, partial [Streptomyces sp. NPDC101234]|uniref:hypothetical protein n=1 Tax=Streptomyces sp. NPDC101234 TaxID=3366138 RepID=UPI003825663E
RQGVHREPEATGLTVTPKTQRSPALRASGPRIAFPPGLKAGIPCEDQGMDHLFQPPGYANSHISLAVDG